MSPDRSAEGACEQAANPTGRQNTVCRAVAGRWLLPRVRGGSGLGWQRDAVCAIVALLLSDAAESTAEGQRSGPAGQAVVTRWWAGEEGA